MNADFPWQTAHTVMVAVLSFWIALPVALAGTLEEADRERHAVFVDVNAHEGPVAVPSLNRIYFTTKPDFAADDTYISIRFVDMETGEVGTLLERSNMANSMWLSSNGQSLLVAEQGTKSTPGRIARIDLATGAREVIVDHFGGKPFNSPNKVLEADTGWIYFTDPDYGHNQGFKSTPQLPMAVYAHDPASSTTKVLTTALDRPHGLALSPDQTILYMTDTDGIDGKHPYNPKGTQAVVAARLLAPDRLGPIRTLASVPVGIPDGLITTAEDGHLWVAAGDGLRRYTPAGELVELFPVPKGVFNVTRYGDALYSTADTAIWRTGISSD